MADVKISALEKVEKLVNGIKIPVSVPVEGGKWKSQSLITSATDFADYTYAGVLSHIGKGTGIDIATAANGEITISSTLDTTVARVVAELPTEGIEEHKIYLVPIEGATGDNVYVEWLRVNNAWEKLGERQIETDLSDYITASDIADRYATIDSVTDITKDNGTIDTKIAALNIGDYAKTADVNSAIGALNTTYASHTDVTNAVKLSADYATSTETNEGLRLQSAYTFEQAFSKLEKAILDNEGVVSSSIAEIKTSVGLDQNLKYSAHGVTSISAAIDALYDVVMAEGDNAPVTLGQLTAGLATKQNVIDADHKLGAALVETTDALQFVTAAQKTEWSGKQAAITESAPLSSDLVDDTDADHKFVSADEKTTWSGKQDKITAAAKLSSDLVDDTDAAHKFVTADQLTKINAAAAASDLDAAVARIAALEAIIADYNSRFEYSHPAGGQATWGKEFLVVDKDEASTTEEPAGE